MQTKEYRTIDKSKFKSQLGAWMQEPDKVQFEDPETGLPCLIVRNQMGALCGYVGVGPGHPLHHKTDAEHTRESSMAMMKATVERTQAGEPFEKVLGDPENPPINLLVKNENYDERLHDLRVHGGVTFTGECQKGREEDGICHTPDEGEEEDITWIGFDCAHSGDFIPAYDSDYVLNKSYLGFENSYKDIDYVKGECRDLAKQLVDNSIFDA